MDYEYLLEYFQFVFYAIVRSLEIVSNDNDISFYWNHKEIKINIMG